MKHLTIPTGESVKAIPMKDVSGKTLCTFYYDPADKECVERFSKATRSVERICRRLNNVSINADGTPATIQYALPLRIAEREIERLICQLAPLDNPEGLFAARRPFASIKGTFYCTHVLKALSEAIGATRA